MATSDLLVPGTTRPQDSTIQLQGLPFRWGCTAAECAAQFPCDALLQQGSIACFRGVSIAAPAPLVFRWLCQLRVATYSYDWLDNRGRQSPRQFIQGLDDLVIGQKIMSIFNLFSFTPSQHLTIQTNADGQRIFGNVVVTYRVVEATPMTSRLIVKIVFSRSGGPAPALQHWLFALGDLIMMRKQLLTFRTLAEQMARRAGLPTA